MTQRSICAGGFYESTRGVASPVEVWNAAVEALEIIWILLVAFTVPSTLNALRFACMSLSARYLPRSARQPRRLPLPCIPRRDSVGHSICLAERGRAGESAEHPISVIDRLGRVTNSRCAASIRRRKRYYCPQLSPDSLNSRCR